MKFEDAIVKYIPMESSVYNTLLTLVDPLDMDTIEQRVSNADMLVPKLLDDELLSCVKTNTGEKFVVSPMGTKILICELGRQKYRDML